MANPRLLSSEEEAAIPLALLDDLRQGRVYAFVGAGLSFDVGLPSWTNLIDEVIKRIAATVWGSLPGETQTWIAQKAKADPTWAAEVLRQIDSPGVDNAIRAIAKAPKKVFSANHALLAVIPFAGYITTNYDTVLDRYLDIFSKHDNAAILPRAPGAYRDYASRYNARPLLKLHGSWDNTSEALVFSHTDYHQLMQDPRYTRLIADVYARHTVLTVGYSLRDPDFRSLITDRREVHGPDVPPMYAFVPQGETTGIEKDTYRKNFNVHIVDFANFADITALLMGIYALVYRLDSRALSDQLWTLLLQRTSSFHGERTPAALQSLVADIERAKRMLSLFDAGIDQDSFSDLCTSADIRLSVAHYRIVSEFDGVMLFPAPSNPAATDQEHSDVAEWLARILDHYSREKHRFTMTTAKRRILQPYISCLPTVLREQKCQDMLFTTRDGEARFDVLKEIYRQNGRWRDWLQILEGLAASTVMSIPAVAKLVLEEQVWILFWTRQGDKLDHVVAAAAARGITVEYKTELRAAYVKKVGLKALLNRPDIKGYTGSDGLVLSWIGRAHARLAIGESDAAKKAALLDAAEAYVQKSLDAAMAQGNLVERAVQSFYLALIMVERRDLAKAEPLAAEVRRIDQSMLSREPGIAWLCVYDYRRALAGNANHSLDAMRDAAKKAFQELGTVDLDAFVDDDYFY